MAERLQKILSAAGVCSRRQAETYIAQGRVTVNGSPAVLGQQADRDTDTILVDGAPLPPAAAPVCILLHKPRGYVSTVSDDRGRPTAVSLVAGCGRRVYPIGRLDLHSEGLLLLTDDGELAHLVLHPSHQVEKVYRLMVSGQVAGCEERLAALRSLEDGTPIRPARVTCLERRGDRALLEAAICQGRNRQLRRMCAMEGLRVHRLVRLREGPIDLGSLPPGKWRYLTQQETAALRAAGQG